MEYISLSSFRHTWYGYQRIDTRPPVCPYLPFIKGDPSSPHPQETVKQEWAKPLAVDSSPASIKQLIKMKLPGHHSCTETVSKNRNLSPQRINRRQHVKFSVLIFYTFTPNLVCSRSQLYQPIQHGTLSFRRGFSYPVLPLLQRHIRGRPHGYESRRRVSPSRSLLLNSFAAWSFTSLVDHNRP